MLMLIRRISPEDAAAFQQLRLRGLRECPEAFSSSHAEEVGTPLHVISARLAPRPDGAVWGCFEGRNLLGMLGVQRESQKQLSHKAVIWGMYVDPHHRRRGLGRALVAHGLGYAADALRARSVNLGVNTRNTAAIALYESMGFGIYGTEKGFLMIDGVLHDQHLMACTMHPDIT